MLDTEDVREILRLKMQVGLSHQQIADATGLSKGVIGKYLGMAAKQGLDWPGVCLLSEAGLMQRLQKGAQRRPRSHVLPDYGSIHLRLAGAGTTLLREWQQYKTDHARQKTYGYTQFCGHYRSFVHGLARSLRQVSRAGERMFANFAGVPVSLNGGVHAHLFLATMAASRYAFACATTGESATDWIRSTVRALDFFGGVPRLIIPDGASGRMPSYAGSDMDLVRYFARHYGTSVLWSMPENPAEKTWAAWPNKVLERWLLRALTRCRPGNMADLERELQRLLTYVNQLRFRGLPGSRASAFAELDGPALFALPAQHYEMPLSGPMEEPVVERMDSVQPFLHDESKPRILLVEADAGMRAYLGRLLGRDYAVIAHASPRLSFQAAMEYEPQAVLTGTIQAQADGFDLLSALRKHVATASIAILALPAGPGNDFHGQGNTGADDYMLHSLNARELLSKTRGMLLLTQVRRKAQRCEEKLRLETRNILDGLDEAFMMVDGDWCITYLNAAAESVIGLSRAHLLKSNYWKVFSAMRGTLIELEYRRAMSSRLPVQFEHYDVRKHSWAEMNARPTEDGGLLLSARDITERKRAQESQERLHMELQAASQLQELGARLLEMPDMDSAMREALSGSIAILHAAMGVIQLYKPQAHTLELAADQGLQKDFVARFHSTNRGDASPMSQVAVTGQRLMIQDVLADGVFAASYPHLIPASVRSCLFTPLPGRKGNILGVLSLFFREARHPCDRELRLLDLYARQVGGLLERMHVEAELRASKDNMGLMLNSITDGLLILDHDARFLYFNAAARKLLAERGVDAEELIGKKYLAEVFREASNDEFGQGFRRAMSQRIPVEVEDYYAPFDHWYLIRYFPMNQNGLAMAIQDTTERRRIEDALRESETRFRALAEASPGLIWQVDAKGDAVYLNPRFRELLGKPLKDLMGTGWHVVVHPEDLRNYVQALDVAVRQHARLLTRVRVRKKDGEWRWLESSALPWFTAEGIYAGHVGISIEIAEAVEMTH
jgi:PAS domain S-box-containing protein